MSAPGNGPGTGPRTGPDAPAGRLPGDLDPRAQVERIIRVDHAGEYGAARIYAGQLAVLRGRTAGRRAIRAMADQEQRHLAAFEELIVRRRVRPTALMPIWHVAGFALGAASALLGERAAMACTIAVEEVIDGHYRRQSETLAADEAELSTRIEECRQDEIHHRDQAIDAGGRNLPGYPVFAAAVKGASRLAIWLSERI